MRNFQNSTLLCTRDYLAHSVCPTQFWILKRKGWCANLTLFSFIWLLNHFYSERNIWGHWTPGLWKRCYVWENAFSLQKVFLRKENILRESGAIIAIFFILLKGHIPCQYKKTMVINKIMVLSTFLTWTKWLISIDM